MDPNANLAELRELVRRRLVGPRSDAETLRTAELVEALDEWLARGGFLPERWAAGRRPLSHGPVVDALVEPKGGPK